MNKSVARILAIGVAVALPTGLFAQSTAAPKPTAAPAPAAGTTSSSASSSTDTRPRPRLPARPRPPRRRAPPRRRPPRRRRPRPPAPRWSRRRPPRSKSITFRVSKGTSERRAFLFSGGRVEGRSNARPPESDDHPDHDRSEEDQERGPGREHSHARGSR